MIEIQADMWERALKDKPDAVCITTCQVTDSRGNLVMGAGIAKQAKEKHPELPRLWGQSVRNGEMGIIITTGLAPYALVGFPTKEHWKDPSLPSLIRQSAKSLLETANASAWSKVFLPRPGCLNGRLDWQNIRPILKDTGLDDRFVIFTR